MNQAQNTASSAKSNRAARRASKGKSTDKPQDDANKSAAQNAASADETTQATGTSNTQENDASAQRGDTSTEENAGASSANSAASGDGQTDSSSSANDAPQAEDEGPSIDSIGSNNKTRRGPIGPRTGAAMGAKPLVRKLLGTLVEAETGNADSMVYPAYSIEELCNATKKSDVNIRTILSDLRSPKYCGTGGVFITHSSKGADGVTRYRFGEKATEQAQSAPQPDVGTPSGVKVDMNAARDAADVEEEVKKMVERGEQRRQQQVEAGDGFVEHRVATEDRRQQQA